MGAQHKIGQFVWVRTLLSIVAIAFVFLAPLYAQNTPVIGSGNTVTADPPVPRPHTKPCVVTLFTNQEFADFNIKPYTYTPPENCPGPWEKVVFTVDFNETTGVQYDRTAQVSLAFVNLYFGTTPEPSATLGPTWHAERDVTDYSALFKTAQNGEANLGNLVNSTYTGIIYGTATLEFYPAHDWGAWEGWSNQNVPRTADAVYPLPDDSGGAKGLFQTTDQLTGTFTLPTNVEQAYLDVIAQNQSNDEFFYTCVPNDVASELQSCGNTAFREVEISIDGTPAGVAPTYPWIFTGGLDPFLWAPIPGVQTLNFVPYRVDLTPFAGLLSNGQPHTVALSVFNANSYFQATATLLVFLDHGAKQVTGAVTENTIGSGPTPVIDENLATDSSGDITGNVTVTSDRAFKVAGYVNTSHGRVDTEVRQTVNYSNSQDFTINANYVQDITQDTQVNSTTTTKWGWFATETQENFHYPLTLNISEIFNSDGSLNIISTVSQGWTRELQAPFYESKVENTVNSADTLELDSSFNLIGNKGQSSSQKYTASDSQGQQYSCTLDAANNVLTNFSKGCTEKAKP
jgi:hypothetical protein